MTTQNTRWNEIKAIWRRHRWLMVLAGFAMGLVALPFMEALFTDFVTLAREFVPHVITAVFIIVSVDFLDRRRDNTQERFNTSQRLLQDVCDASGDVARHAVEEVRQRGWDRDEESIFIGADLFHARLADVNLYRSNLQSVMLAYADLRGANLTEADCNGSRFSGADLRGARMNEGHFASARFQYADLSHAHLNNADIQRAFFWNSTLVQTQAPNIHASTVVMAQSNLQGANFSGARLDHADLRASNATNANFAHADLSFADLRETNFAGADLSGATLRGATIDASTRFDEKTTLPNGTAWLPNVAWGTFTGETTLAQAV